MCRKKLSITVFVKKSCSTFFPAKTDSPAATLFGFQLWLAENKDDLVSQIGKETDEALREAGLAVRQSFVNEFRNF
jgi:hypothetical protein